MTSFCWFFWVICSDLSWNLSLTLFVDCFKLARGLLGSVIWDYRPIIDRLLGSTIEVFFIDTPSVDWNCSKSLAFKKNQNECRITWSGYINKKIGPSIIIGIWNCWIFSAKHINSRLLFWFHKYLDGIYITRTCYCPRWILVGYPKRSWNHPTGPNFDEVLSWT